MIERAFVKCHDSNLGRLVVFGDSNTGLFRDGCEGANHERLSQGCDPCLMLNRLSIDRSLSPGKKA